jgi:hypothetical protein
MFRIIFQRGPYAQNAGIQALLEINKCCAVPDLLPEFLAGNELARSGDERGKKPGRLALQPDKLTFATQFMAENVQLERAETDYF